MKIVFTRGTPLVYTLHWSLLQLGTCQMTNCFNIWYWSLLWQANSYWKRVISIVEVLKEFRDIWLDQVDKSTWKLQLGTYQMTNCFNMWYWSLLWRANNYWKRMFSTVEVLKELRDIWLDQVGKSTWKPEIQVQLRQSHEMETIQSMIQT